MARRKGGLLDIPVQELSPSDALEELPMQFGMLECEGIALKRRPDF
jgi:hypothetical protein